MLTGTIPVVVPLPRQLKLVRLAVAEQTAGSAIILVGNQAVSKGVASARPYIAAPAVVTQLSIKVVRNKTQSCALSLIVQVQNRQTLRRFSLLVALNDA